MLQVKTLLDNADGALARATGRVTLAGRYLDTLADPWSTAAVFAALSAVVTGESGSRARRRRGPDARARRGLQRDRGSTERHVASSRPRPLARGELPASARSSRPIASCSVHCEYVSRKHSLADGSSSRSVGRDRPRTRSACARLAYHDSLTVGVFANLGLTTQLAALGVCLVARRARALPLGWWLGSLFLLPLLQLRRERAGPSR